VRRASLVWMPDAQPQLLDLPVPADPAGGQPESEGGRPRRSSSKAIGPGDIVEVDKRGRRFHALVVELEQLDSGRFELSLRPLDSRINYHRATVREVVAVWRRARR
jgi:hypothetical protein